MRQLKRLCLVLATLTGILLWGVCPPPAWAANPPDRGEQIRALHQEIQTVLQSRETALQAFQARYATAALADRVELEAEGARLIEEYERAYLELLIPYLQLTGNETEKARAEAMLERLNTPPTPAVPLNLDRNLTAPAAPANPDQSVTAPRAVPNPSQEGGVTHAQ